MRTLSHTLVIGIGNPLRGDDGAGPMLCRLLKQHHLQGVECITVHQLTPELAETLIPYDQVLFVDAEAGSTRVELTPLRPITSPASSAHHVNPGLLLSLAGTLYKKNIPGLLCRIPAFDFSTGAPLSPACKRHTAQALTRIEEKLKIS